MSRVAIGLVVVLALSVTGPACQRLPERTPAATQVPSETLARADAIPATWGTLVSVSAIGQYPDLAQLWFQDAGGTIRVVVMRLATMEILHARVIRRH